MAPVAAGCSTYHGVRPSTAPSLVRTTSARDGSLLMSQMMIGRLPWRRRRRGGSEGSSRPQRPLAARSERLPSLRDGAMRAQASRRPRPTPIAAMANATRTAPVVVGIGIGPDDKMTVAAVARAVCAPAISRSSTAVTRRIVGRCSRILVEHAQRQRLQRRIDVRHQCRQRRRRLVDLHRQNLADAVGHERGAGPRRARAASPRAAYTSVGGADIARAAALLGRHVRGRSEDLAGLACEPPCRRRARRPARSWRCRSRAPSRARRRPSGRA